MDDVTTSDEVRLNNQLRLLKAMHSSAADKTRVRLTEELGVGRGTMSSLMSQLGEAHLVREVRAESGGRGRPGHMVKPHPEGPRVLVADVKEDHWELSRAELGGDVRLIVGGPLDGRPDQVLTAIRNAIDLVIDERTVAIAVAVPGLVESGRYVNVAHLGWEQVDFAAIGRRGWPKVLVGNDARSAGLAEARRGALRGVGTALHLHVDFDLGGTLLIDGRNQGGANGVAGEYGHMPLGGGYGRCMCGLEGCWGLQVGLNALLNAEGIEPGWGRGREDATEVLRQAYRGEDRALSAVKASAVALARGIGILSNALDPGRVGLSGMAVDLWKLYPKEMERVAVAAQMPFRRDSPPTIVPTLLEDKGIAIGAMESAFDEFLTLGGLKAWIERFR
ncbi:ROK family protein [Salininema proteolyticum]|uniref:ROK family protein n=1 Tax=Salininema proteolyticum TaxID=1607685 RepID=A0ABV8U3L3_9ACTN